MDMNTAPALTVRIAYANYDDFTLAQYAWSHEIEHFTTADDTFEVILSSTDLAIDELEEIILMHFDVMAKPELYDPEQLRCTAVRVARA